MHGQRQRRGGGMFRVVVVADIGCSRSACQVDAPALQVQRTGQKRRELDGSQKALQLEGSVGVGRIHLAVHRHRFRVTEAHVLKVQVDIVLRYSEDCSQPAFNEEAMVLRPGKCTGLHDDQVEPDDLERVH